MLLWVKSALKCVATVEKLKKTKKKKQSENGEEKAKN
jgi:hypothetical protein